MIIEDDAIIAMLIENELRDLGYSSIDTASTEDEAIEAVARRCPDLITPDGSLFDGTGVGAVRKIQSTTDRMHSGLRTIPERLGQLDMAVLAQTRRRRLP